MCANLFINWMGFDHNPISVYELTNSQSVTVPAGPCCYHVGYHMTSMRQEKRISAVLPVRVSGHRGKEPFTCLAHTLNVSHGGALLSGFQVPLPVDSVIYVHRGMKYAKFRVMWVANDPFTPQLIGIECLHRIGDFWHMGRRVPPSQVDEFLAMLDRTSVDEIFSQA